MTEPIPDGYHSVTPSLTIRGASKAIEFYKTAFGAQEMNRHPVQMENPTYAERLKIPLVTDG